MYETPERPAPPALDPALTTPPPVDEFNEIEDDEFDVDEEELIIPEDSLPDVLEKILGSGGCGCGSKH